MSVTLAAPAAIDPVSAGMNLGSSAANLITELQKEANSPDAVKAAQAKERLAQWDELATAQAGNQIEVERAFLERRMSAIQQQS
jgi:hypothetical protein